MSVFQALVLSLPTRNSTLRMRLWRTLRDAGCGALRDGVYVLPAQAPGGEVLGAMEAEIRSAGGSAMTLEMKPRSAAQLAEVHKLFDRSALYGALVRDIGKAKAALAQLGSRKGRTAVRRLQRAFDRLAQIDFFPGHAHQQAAGAMAELNARYEELHTEGEPRATRKRTRRVDPARYRKRLWATRRDLWIDRIASAWLIKRFIDREAKFVWIDGPRHRPARAVGFDFNGAEFTHSGDRVTFEALLASFGLERDPALAAIGAAVHYLDVGGIPVADAKGLETVLRGIKEKAANDDALLAEAIRILDLFYSAYSREKAG